MHHTVNQLPSSVPVEQLVVEPAGDLPTPDRAPRIGASTEFRRPLPVRDLIRLARPKQWVKNLLVIPLVLPDMPNLGRGDLVRIAWAIVVFTLASSLVYVWNDIADRQRDQAHPVKRQRPIASGRVSPRLAVTYGAGLAVLTLAAVSAGPAMPWWPLGCYLVLNVVYSRWLRHVPLLDVFTIAAGFVLRALQGYVATGTAISGWLHIAVFALCLVLILGKRHNELIVSGNDHRRALHAYSTQYLEYLMVICATLAVTSFMMYLTTPKLFAPYTDLVLLVSAPFGTLALARYLQLVVMLGEGGEPVRVLLHDRIIVVSTATWAALLAMIILAARVPGLPEAVFR